MAKRVNKKLLFIVSTCTLVTLGVAGFVAMNAYRADATRFVRAGDAEMQAGEFRKAATFYGRAIGKQPNNTAYHGKFIEASRRIVPESASEARERYGQYVASLRRRAQLGRTDEQLWRELFAEQRLQAEFFDTVGQWQGIYDSIGSDMFSLLAPDDPVLAMGKANRGYAQSRRAGGLAPTEVAEAIAELESAMPLLKGADLDLAYGGLLNFRLHQARLFESANQARQAAEAWTTFDALLAQALAAAPSGYETRRLELARLRIRRDAGDASVEQADIDAAARRLVDLARASGDPILIYEAWKSVAPLGGPERLDVPLAMLEEYVQKNPDALLHRKLFATGLQYVDIDRAQREAIAVLETPRLPVGFASATQDEVRANAAQQIFDIQFSRFGAAEPDARPAALAQLEAARERIRELTAGLPDDSILLKTDGKLAFAKGDYATAAVRFNEVFRRGSLVDAELYVLASVNAEQMNELGIALERTIQGLAFAPGNFELLERRAALEFRLGRFSDSLRTAQRILERAPNRTLAKSIADAATAAMANRGVVDESDPIVQLVTKAQAAFDRQDYAAAKRDLETALAANPRELRLIRALAQVLASSGEREKAIEMAKRGLELAPSDPTLVRLIAFASSDDPVTRVQEAVAQIYPEGPDRVVWTYIRMANLLEQTEGAVGAFERTDPVESARQAGLLPAMRSATETWRERATAVDPNHPALVEYRFGQAIEAKDYRAAAELVALAETARRDPALAPILKARLELAQGRAGTAADILRRALDASIETADIHRVLGIAQEQMGDMTSAVRSFSEAYKRKPTDMNNVRFYVQALSRTGDRQQALAILREARRVAVDEQSIGEAWLALEAEIGDRNLARTTRETRYRLVPSDRTNAIALAAMLAELQPDREDVVDASGNPRFTEPQWRNLGEADRVRELERTRTAWRERSDEVFATLLAAEPASVELAAIRAAAYRRQGRYPLAEQTLVKLTERPEVGQRPDAWIALGVQYAESGDPTKASAAFGEAVKRGDDATRDADLSIGEYWFQRGQWERAASHFERVAEKRKERQVELRLAEAYARLRKFDLAQERLAQAISAGGRDSIIDQLEANIDEGRGDALVAQGKKTEALEAYGKGLAALKRAADAMPTNPIIYVQQASLERKRYEAGGDRKWLTAAQAAAEQAVRLRADFWPAAQAKSDLFLVAGDTPAALAELERFVASAPGVPDGRRRLVEVLAGTGNTRRAAEVVRDGISLNPNDPQLFALLGEIELVANRIDQAVLAYEQADRIRPTTESLHRLTDLRMRKTPPDWSGVLAGLRDRSEDVRMSPYLQSATGAAMVNTGQQRQGLDALRESYRFARQSVRDGLAQPSVFDGWYGNLRLAFPVARTSEAERFLIEVAADGINARDYRALAELWLNSGTDGPKRALEFVGKGLALDDGKDVRLTGRLHDLAGSAHYLMGDCRKAVDSFARAAEVLPNDAVMLNNFAYLAADCGDDPKRGLPAALRAVELAPNRADFLDTLGFVQARTGDRAAATETLLRSLRVTPNASANFHLAQIAHEENRLDEARRYLQAAGDLKPDPILQGKINELIAQLR